MHDNWIIAAALCVAALGIVLLLLALILVEPSLVSIADANALPDGEPLRLKGTVRGVQGRGSFTVMTLEQPATVDVLLEGVVNITPGSCVIVQGKRSSYKGSLQLSATKVMPCKG